MWPLSRLQSVVKETKAFGRLMCVICAITKCLQTVHTVVQFVVLVSGIRRQRLCIAPGKCPHEAVRCIFSPSGDPPCFGPSVALYLLCGTGHSLSVPTVSS